MKPKLPIMRDANIASINICGDCCQKEWLGGADFIGWKVAGNQRHYPIELVAQCKTCCQHWSTHAIIIREEDLAPYLPQIALRKIELWKLKRENENE